MDKNEDKDKDKDKIFYHQGWMCIVEAPWSLDGGRRRAWALSHVPFALCSCQIQTHKYKDKGKYSNTKKNVQIQIQTRPSVNYAKDWLDQSFLFPGLVWRGKGFHLGCDHYGPVNNHFPLHSCVLCHFWHGGTQMNKQTNN